MSFPDIVYKSPGRHFGPPGKTFDFKGVKDDAELSAALADGWFRTLPEACAERPMVPAEPVPVVEPVSVPPDDAPPTRDELKAKAAELGLKYDGRISDAKLLALINEAVADADPLPPVV